MVTFIKNHYRVPHMVVREVNMEFGAFHCPTPADLHWEPYQPGRSRERDREETGVWWWLGCLTPGFLTRTMLDLVVLCHQPIRQVLCTLWSPYLLLFMFPKIIPYPNHIPLVSCLQVLANHITWPANHNHHLVVVGVEAYFTKEIHQDFQRLLKFVRSR